MANLKTNTKKTKAQSMGLHTEVLTGKTQQKFFNPDEAENFFYWGTHDVDFNKRTELDVKEIDCKLANEKIDRLMSEGYGTIVIKNPQGKHSLGVGILNKLNLIFEGSLGYFGVGSIDGPVVRVNGRVGWSCAENMMAGKVVIEKNAGSCFGANRLGCHSHAAADAGYGRQLPAVDVGAGASGVGAARRSQRISINRHRTICGHQAECCFGERAADGGDQVSEVEVTGSAPCSNTDRRSTLATTSIASGDRRHQ